MHKAIVQTDGDTEISCSHGEAMHLRLLQVEIN